MAIDSSSQKLAGSSDDSKEKGKSNQAVVDFLQAPRKKRKSYVVLAVGPTIDPDVVSALQRFMKTQYSKLTFVVARSLEDFVKYSTRNIILAIVDDQLATRLDTLKVIRKLKEQKTDGPMPTLFLTRDSKTLISEYQGELQAWHEVDEYINLADSPRHALFTKIKAGIENRYQRRGRRYKVSIPVYFQVLDSGDVKFKGMLLDFSIHGALIHVAESAHHFSTKDQIMVHMPLSQFVQGASDIFRVAGRVRRVLISGDKAGVSWEHLSEEKITTMTKMLITIVDGSLAKAAGATRAKINKANQDLNLTNNDPK